jgi:hypothetical protein
MRILIKTTLKIFKLKRSTIKIAKSKKWSGEVFTTDK